MYVEKKVNGKWVTAEAWMKDEENKYDVPFPQKVYNGRNYDLFGFLTEGKVRSDIGIYVGKYKGFPKDVSSKVKKRFDEWGVDAHTPNYITLKEFNQVNWNLSVEGMPLKEKFSHFFYDVIFRLDFYDIRVHNPAHIRLVFWFDN